MLSLIEHLKSRHYPLFVGGATPDAWPSVRSDLDGAGADYFAAGIGLETGQGAYLIVSDAPFHSPDSGPEAFVSAMLDGRCDGLSAELSGRDAAGTLLACVGSEFVGPCHLSPAWSAIAGDPSPVNF